MKKFMLAGIVGVVSVLTLGAVLWGPIVSNSVEQAKYVVVASYDEIEIRDYSEMIVAEVEVSGNRKEAVNKGFRLIADYIFGNNNLVQEVAMTAPVLQQSGEKISMTAPVIQEGKDNVWKVRFVMPSTYTIKTLPKPNNDVVKLREIPSKRFVVIRFSGLASEKSLQVYGKKLDEFVSSQNLKVNAQPEYAFFNPPWTLPFLRRNEIMIEIVK